MSINPPERPRKEPMTEPLSVATIEELEKRIGSEFDDELTLSGDEARRLLAAARRVAELERELAKAKAFDGLVRMRVADLIMETHSGESSADAWWIVDAAWERAKAQTAASSSASKGFGPLPEFLREQRAAVEAYFRGDPLPPPPAESQPDEKP